MRKQMKIEQKIYNISPKEGYLPEQYAISPDDKYLAIGLKLVQFGREVNKITEVQILDLGQMKIIQIIKLPDKLINQTTLSSLILRFSNDSSNLYISDRDNIFYVSTQRKQISKFKAHDSPIQNIIELKSRMLMYSTNKNFYIIRKNKIIKKMNFKNNRQFQIDYNPLTDLIMIQEPEQILIISMQTLHILCTYLSKQILKNAFFLQNNIITLDTNSDIKVWEIHNINQQLVLNEIYYQSLWMCEFEMVLKLELSINQNFIILFKLGRMFIIDQRLKLIEVVNIIFSNDHCQRYQQNSKSKVYYFDSNREIIYILPFSDDK